MQEAVPAGEGAMAAILGVDAADGRGGGGRGRGQGGVCELANDNGEGQRCISGTVAAVERAVALAKERGRPARRAAAGLRPLPLRADGAGGRAAGRGARRGPRSSAPAVPVIANVTAEPVQDPAAIRELLVRQVTARVRWRESMATMARLGRRTR